MPCTRRRRVAGVGSTGVSRWLHPSRGRSHVSCELCGRDLGVPQPSGASPSARAQTVELGRIAVRRPVHQRQVCAHVLTIGPAASAAPSAERGSGRTHGERSQHGRWHQGWPPGRRQVTRPWDTLAASGHSRRGLGHCTCALSTSNAAANSPRACCCCRAAGSRPESVCPSRRAVAASPQLQDSRG